MSDRGDSYYELLFVARDAPREVIEASFRALMKRLHPDRGGDHDQARLLNDARDTLCDDHRRRGYDVALVERDAHQAAILCPHCEVANPVDCSDDVRINRLRCSACKSSFTGPKRRPLASRPKPERSEKARPLGRYWAEESGDHYHRPTCLRGRRMSASAPREWFGSREEAVAAVRPDGESYSACPSCMRRATR